MAHKHGSCVALLLHTLCPNARNSLEMLVSTCVFKKLL